MLFNASNAERAFDREKPLRTEGRLYIVSQITYMKSRTYSMSVEGAALDDVTSGCFEQQLDDGKMALSYCQV